MDKNDAVTCNKFFIKYQEGITLDLCCGNSGDYNYERGENPQLLELCQEHARKYNKPKRWNKSIILTHPLFLNLSDRDFPIDKEIKKGAENYLDRLSFLLNFNRKKSNVGIVALETIHNYAAATSKLLEQGLIDQAIFTQNSRGTTLKPYELEQFKEDALFFGGGYNGYCLYGSICQMSLHVKESKQIWAVRDLVVDRPENNTRICRTSNLEVVGVSLSRTISLKEALEKLTSKDL